MRRADREVTDATAVAEIMSRCDVVRLAMNTDSVPYILPVNFGMEPDGMTIYIHGAMTGTKYDMVARDNRVSFEMDCVHGLELDEVHRECSVVYESVIGWGYLEEVTGREEKLHALKRLMRQLHAENFEFGHGPLDHTRVFRLNIQQRTAKSRRKMV